MKNKNKTKIVSTQIRLMPLESNTINIQNNDHPQIQTKYTHITKNTKNDQIISLTYYFAFFFVSL